MLRIALRAFQALAPRERMLLVIGMLAGCYFLFDFFVYTPTTKNMRAIKQQIEALDANLQEYYADFAGYRQLEQEVASLREKSKACEERLAHLEQPETILETLAMLCRNYGIEILSLKPQEQKLQTPTHLRYCVTMELRCTFQKTAQLLAALRALPFYMTVNRLSIRHDEKDLVIVSLVTETFVPGDKPL